MSDRITEHVQRSRPILDDWASELGLKIEWVHGWEKEGALMATAFADNHSVYTVTLPAGQSWDD